jgi:hypothetical protein
VQWRFPKECIDKALIFISKLSEEIQIVSLQARVLAEQKYVKSVHGLGEGNELLQIHKGVE